MFVGEGHTVLRTGHTLLSLQTQPMLWKQMGQGHLLWRVRRVISETDSSAPRGASRSMGCWDDRSAITIISAVILQVLGSTSACGAQDGVSVWVLGSPSEGSGRRTWPPLLLSVG